MQSAKITSDGTAYGKVKNIDVTFPFRTYINPKKGAEIKIEAPGYEEYNLVIVKGGIESDYQIVLTPDIKEQKKKNNSRVKSEENNRKESKNKFDRYTFPITIECDQVKTAKLSATRNLYGMFMNYIDISFPFTDKVDPTKGAVIMLKVPGYYNYKLVIPPGSSQTHYKVHFTEDPDEMAKILKKENKHNYYTANDNNYAHNNTQQYKEAVSRETPGESILEKTIICWMIDSDPQGARIFWRVISSIPEEVKNTNESYLLTTPYEETRSFNILGLTYENSRDVQIEIKLMKPGYHTQVKRFNVRQAIDQQEISTFFQLVPKEE